MGGVEFVDPFHARDSIRETSHRQLRRIPVNLPAVVDIGRNRDSTSTSECMEANELLHLFVHQDDTARTLRPEIYPQTARSHGLHHARCQRRDIVFRVPLHRESGEKQSDRAAKLQLPRGEAWEEPRFVAFPMR